MGRVVVVSDDGQGGCGGVYEGDEDEEGRADREGD